MQTVEPVRSDCGKKIGNRDKIKRLKRVTVMRDLKSPITQVKGIGTKYAGLLAKMNIETMEDLIYYFPRNYESFPKTVQIAQMLPGQKNAVFGMIVGSVNLRRVRNLSILQFDFADQTGQCRVTIFNMPYLKNSLHAGKQYVFYGRTAQNNTKWSMEQPALYTQEEYCTYAGTLRPRYALTKGLTNKTIQNTLHKIMDRDFAYEDPLSENLCKRYQLLPLRDALYQIHFPADKETYFAARKRLVFQEFLYFLIQSRSERTGQTKTENPYRMIQVAETKRLIEALPYRLTGAQQKVWEQIEHDLQGDDTMNRLIQGDVGSGKTIVAILALLMTAANGFQCAMMAPTEVLARQHFQNIANMTETYHLPFRPVLLTGSLTAKEKRLAYEAMASGEANLVIGTQALIQEKALYQKLALVITDEQHRFGVRQRETLAEKGCFPHILVMSATPIPRTLAIILFGDLSVSVIDEYPKERLPVKSCVLLPEKRPEALAFLLKRVREGRQAYIICPMVEDGAAEELQDVITYTEKLKCSLPREVRCAYLHGKMKNAEKNQIMDAFSQHHIDILVSTTVVEVGVDVPNATVIMIENAERFGLAALHQLRGRVGRGADQSYCIFMSAAKSCAADQRLSILTESNDGFYIANEDMKLRGPGDIFGIRQSGVLEFKLGDIYQDSDLLKLASECCDYLLDHEEELQKVLSDMRSRANAMVDFRTI